MPEILWRHGTRPEHFENVQFESGEMINIVLKVWKTRHEIQFHLYHI